ncbi:37332_t:CDS:2, partial [Gigaspora margarita]
EKEIEELIIEYKSLFLERNKKIAEFLGISNPGVVFVVRKISELVEWKQLDDQQETLTPATDNCSVESKKVKELILQLSKKIAIGLQEARTSDYGIQDVEKQIKGILECLLNDADSESLMKRKLNEEEAKLSQERVPESSAKILATSDSLQGHAYNEKGITTEITQLTDICKTQETKQTTKIEEINYILWDIPFYYTSFEIINMLKPFGKVSIKKCKIKKKNFMKLEKEVCKRERGELSRQNKNKYEQVKDSKEKVDVTVKENDRIKKENKESCSKRNTAVKNSHQIEQINTNNYSKKYNEMLQRIMAIEDLIKGLIRPNRS